MKNYPIYNKNDIVVAIHAQMTSCGIEYIREGSILKVANESPKWRDTVSVFRNKKAENNNNYHFIDKDNIRPAKEIEIEMYNNEIYFITTVKTY